MSDLSARVRETIRDVPDFPKPGIVFKDITPVLSDSALFGQIIDWMAAPWIGAGVQHVVGMESRGFIFAAPLALRLGAAFVPARKPGKLPWKHASVSYDLEYGSASLEIHEGAFGPGDRVLVVDDVLATGGTAAATVQLVRKLGGDPVGTSFLIELGFLRGSEKLDVSSTSLITY